MGLTQTLARENNRLRGLFSNAYYRITNVSLDQESGKARIQLKGYADEDARRYPESTMPEPHHPMPHSETNLVEYTVEVDLPEILPVNLMEWAYGEVKKDSRLSSAQDVLEGEPVE